MPFTTFGFTEEELQLHFKSLFLMVVTVVQFFKNIWVYYFKVKDYYIQQANFIYIRDGEEQIENITREYRKYGPIKIIEEKSKEVTDFLFQIEYLYNSKSYVYLTRNPTHVFPPLKREMKFSLPVNEAFILDSDNVPMYNITQYIKMYEGPHFDFHGETILLKDAYMLYADNIESPRLRLTNILGTTVEYDMQNDSISHQSLWLPNKT